MAPPHLAPFNRSALWRSLRHGCPMTSMAFCAFEAARNLGFEAEIELKNVAKNWQTWFKMALRRLKMAKTAKAGGAAQERLCWRRARCLCRRRCEGSLCGADLRRPGLRRPGQGSGLRVDLRAFACFPRLKTAILVTVCLWLCQACDAP